MGSRGCQNDKNSTYDPREEATLLGDGEDGQLSLLSRWVVLEEKRSSGGLQIRDLRERSSVEEASDGAARGEAVCDEARSGEHSDLE